MTAFRGFSPFSATRKSSFSSIRCAPGYSISKRWRQPSPGRPGCEGPASVRRRGERRIERRIPLARRIRACFENRVARATRPPRSATCRPEVRRATLWKGRRDWFKPLTPFRPASRRTAQVGRLFHPNSNFQTRSKTFRVAGRRLSPRGGCGRGRRCHCVGMDKCRRWGTMRGWPGR
jgi:hypothetical protein